MPKAKKLPSGSYRCRIYLGDEMVDGKRRQIAKSFTAPTKDEAELMASQYKKLHGNARIADMTLSDAISRYIAAKSNILSPATIRGYRKDADHVLEPLKAVQISKLDSETVQRWINTQAATYSPKTIKNGCGLLTAACSAIDPTYHIRVTYPKKKKAERYIPSYKEVMQLIDAAPSDNLRKSIMLAAFGSLRRGEICALTPEDVDPTGWISVTKDMIKDERGEYIIKDMPKTLESCRRVPVPDFVIEELQSGLVDCTPHAITVGFERLVKACKLPHIRFHDLRHFFASYLHMKGIPDAYIEKYGGWKPGSSVMQSIYRNIINAEEKKQAQKIVKIFSPQQKKALAK